MNGSPRQQAVAEAVKFVDTFNQEILFPIIALLSGIALLVFLFGCAEYIIGSASPEARKTGVRHITFGLVGLVIMVSAWSILLVATATFGLDDELKCADDPTASGC